MIISRLRPGFFFLHDYLKKIAMNLVSPFGMLRHVLSERPFAKDLLLMILEDNK